MPAVSLGQNSKFGRVKDLIPLNFTEIVERRRQELRGPTLDELRATGLHDGDQLICGLYGGLDDEELLDCGRLDSPVVLENVERCWFFLSSGATLALYWSRLPAE